MTINYTTLLGLAEPVTGTESGTWGDDVNKGLTDYLDAAIAGAQTISGSQTAVTLSITNGSSSGNNLAQAGTGTTGSSQYQIINCTGNHASLLTITVPASSKTYVVINQTSTSQSVKVVGSGPTTGVTVISGEKALIAWSGSDFVKVGELSGDATFRNLTAATITNTGLTSGRVVYSTTGGLETDSANLTFTGTVLGLGAAGVGALFQGDFSNATFANRTSFQTSTTNATTGIYALPNGTSTAASWQAFNNSNPTNASKILIATNGSTDVQLVSGINGTGTYLPLSFYTNGSQQAQLDTSGNFTLSNGNIILSAGTANGVAYLNGSKVLTTGSALTFNGTSLGIGTSSPARMLDIYDATAPTFSLHNSTSGTTASDGFLLFTLGSDVTLINYENGSMAFGTNGSEQMRLTSTGLGIGTSSPTYKLDVVTSGTSGGRIYTAEYGQFVVTDGTRGVYIQNYTGLGAIGTSSNNALMFAVNSTERMRLDTGGNLGLGVTPSTWATYKAYQVGWSSLAGYASADTAVFSNAYFDGGYKYIGSSYASQYRQINSSHQWFTAPSGTAGNAITFTQAMTLDASGNLLVGTTTASGNPTQGVVTLPNSNAALIGIGHASGTASGSAYMTFNYNGGAGIGSITQSGTTAVLFNVTSDQRLKENIVDAPEFGSVIDAIQVRSYDWKSDHTHQRAGFIAQELVTVAPEAVHQPADPEQMMAVDYSKLVPMLVKEIQSLRKRLAAAGIA